MILVHDRTIYMGLPGVSRYRSKRAKREPLAFLTKTRNTSTTKPNLADCGSFHLYCIYNFISPRIKRSLFIAEVGGSTHLLFPFVWREVDKEFQNESTYSTIRCSIPRPVGISQSKMWAPITVTQSHYQRFWDQTYPFGA